MNRAFSLVELSIVLVILGLLTGGILAGKSLIRASELRAVNTEYSRYVTAFRAFQDKYLAKPGDMTNATSFWGAADPTPATCKTTPSSSPATCNGNGNGRLDAPASSAEQYRIWQHLANAGLIEGTYTGVASADRNGFGPSAEPASRMNDGTWYIVYMASPGPTTEWFTLPYENDLEFFSAANAPWGILKGEEAWNIDTKVDDGLPGKGRVISSKGSTTLVCTSVAGTTVDTDAVYNLSDPNPSCYLHFPRAL